MFLIFASPLYAFLSLSEGSQHAGQPAPALFSSLRPLTHTSFLPSVRSQRRLFRRSSFSFALAHVIMDSGLETCSPPSTPRAARNRGTSCPPAGGHPSGFASQVLRPNCTQCPPALSRSDRGLQALHFGREDILARLLDDDDMLVVRAEKGTCGKKLKTFTRSCSPMWMFTTDIGLFSFDAAQIRPEANTCLHRSMFGVCTLPRAIWCRSTLPRCDGSRSDGCGRSQWQEALG